MEFETELDFKEQLRSFFANKASSELTIDTLHKPDKLPSYVQLAILNAIGHRFAHNYMKNPTLQLTTTPNFFSPQNQRILDNILLDNRRRRSTVNRNIIFTFAGIALGMGGFCVFGGSPYSFLLMAFLGGIAGSIAGEIRDNNLIESSEFYDTPDKIAQITNKQELSALELGVESTEWRSYLANFRREEDTQAAYDYPQAFKAGLKAAEDGNTPLLEAIGRTRSHLR